MDKERTIGDGGPETQKFLKGEKMTWEVRWDTHPVKGPHLSTLFEISKLKKWVKYAHVLIPGSPQWFNKGPMEGQADQTFINIQTRCNKHSRYVTLDNLGLIKPVFPIGADRARKDLINYFKKVALGELPY